MRPIHSLPLAAAILLAACSGGAEDAAADGEVTAEELAAAADGMVQPRPGQYSTSIELIEFDMPGLGDQAKQQMQAMVGGEMAQGNEFCLTPEEAAENGAQKMMENLAESDCTFSKFAVAGGSIDAAMQCAGEGGMTSTVAMTGAMTAESSDMTMAMDQEMAGAGKMHMKMRVKSQRTGECA
jgi:hypothetical protein